MEKKNRDNNHGKLTVNGDDATKNGEFIPTFDNWLPLDEQKNRARKHEKLTEGVCPDAGDARHREKKRI